MFSNQFSRFHRTLTFRLNIWYVSIFMASAAVLFTLIYVLMARALERKDAEIIEARTKEYAAIYETGGVRALQRWLFSAQESREPFLVRVISPRNTISLLAVPPDWIEPVPEDLGRTARRSGLPLRIPKDAEHDLVLASMVLPDGSLLQVGRMMNSRQTLLRPFQRIFFIVITPVVILGFVGGAIFAHRVTRPVREVVATARTIIRTGDLNARVSEGQSNDELAEMARLFNDLLAKNQTLISKMRESLDNVAHDLRTPMTRLRGIAEMALRSDHDATAMSEALADCIEESDRVLTILKTLMDVAEAEAGTIPLIREKVKLTAMMEEVIELYSCVAEEKRITVRKELDGSCEAMIDQTRMRQVFANLLDNALKYTEPGGTVELSVRGAGAEVMICFKDTGIGIPAHEMDRIWDRLFRGDKSRSQRGLGLGLSLVKAIVEAHKGQVEVSSEPGRGSELRVYLPATSESESPRKKAMPESAVANV